MSMMNTLGLIFVVFDHLASMVPQGFEEARGTSVIAARTSIMAKKESILVGLVGVEE